MLTGLSAQVDYLDDGSPVRFISFVLSKDLRLTLYVQINLKVDIDPKEGSAVFDFAGTGWEVRGNLNAPISVVHSAVIYCMRGMLDLDIPLNAGCLVPVTSVFIHWSSCTCATC